MKGGGGGELNLKESVDESVNVRYCLFFWYVYQIVDNFCTEGSERYVDRYDCQHL